MKWFKNLKTLPKLMLAFCVMCLLLALIGFQGISAANTLNGTIEKLYNRELMGLSAIKDANIDRSAIGRDLRAAIIATEKTEADERTASVEKAFVSMYENLDRTEKTLDTDEGRAKLAKIRELLPQYEAGVKDIARMNSAGQKAEAVANLGKFAGIIAEVQRAFNDLSDAKEKVAKKSYEDANAMYAQTRTNMLLIMGCALLLAIGLGYFIAQLIARPLAETVAILDKVAQGDLTAKLKVETTDEIGEMAASLNRATEGMRTALSEVRASADSMASAAQELASSSEELASGAQEQASSLEETTSTLEEITSTVKQNADNAKQANQVATGSRDTAEKGGQVVAEAVTAMGEINESSKNIAEIITTIDEIAFQTNLLALNAAVEAARAGEQGRGFAVVATEVRNLAQRSATSAKEIKRLIQDSVRKVENGSTLVNKSGETLHEIVGSVKRVTDIVAEIAAASREQSVGIEQVNKAMMQMDQVTQANSSQTEELSSTAQSLASHAQQLQSLVERFRLDESGQRQQHAAPAPAANRTVALTPAKPRTYRQNIHIDSPLPPPKVKPNGHDTSANAFEEF